MALWTPADYAGSDKYAWLRLKGTGAATASAITYSTVAGDTTNVRTVNDKWGSNHFTAPEPTADWYTMPLGTLNGHDALDFSLTDHHLNGPNIATAYTGPVTIIVIAEQGAQAKGALVGSKDNYLGLYAKDGSTAAQHFGAGFNGSENWSLSPPTSGRVGYIVFDNTTNEEVSADGHPPTSWASNAHTIGSATDCWQLGRWANGETFVGTIGEAIIIHGRPSQADIDRFVGYLIWDWYGDGTRLPTGHTYKSAAPTVAASGYTLTAAAGSYVLTGQAAGALKQSRVTADAGAYALTGVAAGLTKSAAASYSLTAEPGAYTLTGIAANTRKSTRMAAEAGAYALTGVAANLLKTTAGAYVLLADTGVYLLSGQDAGLAKTSLNNYTLTAEPGLYSLTGLPVTLTADIAFQWIEVAYPDDTWTQATDPVETWTEV